MNIDVLLEGRGFTYYPTKYFNKNKHLFSLYISFESIIFKIESEEHLADITNFLFEFKRRFKYNIVMFKDEQIMLSVNDGLSFIKIESSDILDEDKFEKTFKAESVDNVNYFEDMVILKYTAKKDVTLSDGERWVNKNKTWRKAFPDDISNEYFNSALFFAPIGVHFLKYNNGKITGVLKALGYLFTGGLFGISYLDSLIMFLFGKNVLLSAVYDIDSESKETKLMFVSKQDNWKKILIALPYTIIIVVVMLFVDTKIIEVLSGILQEVLNRFL